MTEVVLLAGGKSRRMGTDKLLLPQNGTTVLQAAVSRFSSFFDKVYLSVGEAGKYPEISAEHLVDSFPGCGPMAGLLEGLKVSQSGGVFLAAADIPFSDPERALKIIAASGGYEICVTVDGQGRYEPLFGYYRASVADTVLEFLQAGNYRIAELFQRHNTLVLEPAAVPGIWNERAFANMNFPEDYRMLLQSMEKP